MSPETFNEFADLVRRMRQKQKDYFRTRNPVTLGESKDLERRVDALLDPPPRTPGLFDGTPDPAA
jgi:hypothetical protein